MKLSTNMRAQLFGDETDIEFSEKLLKLGEGRLRLDNNGDLQLTPISTIVNSVEELIVYVFPNVMHHYQNHDWICERAILAPKNVTVNNINDKLLKFNSGKFLHI